MCQCESRGSHSPTHLVNNYLLECTIYDDYNNNGFYWYKHKGVHQMFIESYIYVCIKRPKNTEQTVNSEGTSLVRYVMPANIVGSCIKSEYCNVGPLSRAGPGAESPRDGFTSTLSPQSARGRPVFRTLQISSSSPWTGPHHR